MSWLRLCQGWPISVILITPTSQIVNHADAQGVCVIKLESLVGICEGATRTSRGASARKNNRMQNTPQRLPDGW